MTLAMYIDPATVLEECQSRRPKKRVDTQPDADTVCHIATLLKQGVRRGIVPQWTLKVDININPTHDDLTEIAEQMAEGYSAGFSPIEWRIEHYE